MDRCGLVITIWGDHLAGLIVVREHDARDLTSQEVPQRGARTTRLRGAGREAGHLSKTVQLGLGHLKGIGTRGQEGDLSPGAPY